MPILASRESCTGCTACMSACRSNCITMKADAEGFAFPEINKEQCVECGACVRRCPVLNRPELPSEMPKAYGAHSVRDDLRARSSSGGFFSELAELVLAKGGAVYGAAYGEDYRVHHIRVHSAQELKKLCGAKYAQSDLGDTFRSVKKELEEGTMVLFSGTPCQAAGLRTFLGKDYDGLILVDFVCHGVPSPEAWTRYVSYRAAQDNNGTLPKSINMRSKHTGWSRYRYSNLYTYDGKKYTAGSAEDLFMRLFVGDQINRLSCAGCAFKGYNRVSDFTMGDFWGAWDILPEMDDDRGMSVLLVHTAKGASLLEQFRDNLNVMEITLEEASRQNPAMLRSSPVGERRAWALTTIQEGCYAEVDAAFVYTKPIDQKPSLAYRAVRKIYRILTRKEKDKT